MLVVYWEIIWFGGIVIVLTVTALVGLWKRENPDDFEPLEPMALSTRQRTLFRQEKVLAMQKAERAKRATKQAIKTRRQELVRSRQQAVGTTGPGDGKSEPAVPRRD